VTPHEPESGHEELGAARRSRIITCSPRSSSTHPTPPAASRATPCVQTRRPSRWLGCAPSPSC